MGKSELWKLREQAYPIKINGKVIEEAWGHRPEEHLDKGKHLIEISDNIDTALSKINFEEMLGIDEHGAAITINNLVFDKNYNVIWIDATYTLFTDKVNDRFKAQRSKELIKVLNKNITKKSINPNNYQLDVDYLNLGNRTLFFFDNKRDFKRKVHESDKNKVYTIKFDSEEEYNTIIEYIEEEEAE